ncbi:MAG: MarP family serine protease [Solirubrobacteraceae bacterium]
MTGTDWIIVVLVVLLGAFGYARGFLSGALSLAGFAAGAWVGTRLGPLVLDEGKGSPFAPLFGLVGAMVAGVVLAAGFGGFGSRLGFVVRRAPGLGLLDGLLGAVLMAVLGLALAWVLGAVALQTPGARRLRGNIQRSAILAALNDVLPSRSLLNALARFDPFPRLRGPNIAVAPPSARIARDPQVAASKDSVVKILGTACGLGLEGSGWVAAPGIVVTNAHVVAGEDDTSVHVGGGDAGLDATAVHFDPRNDIAVLRVPGLDARPLPLAGSPRAGTGAAILGYPLDGPYRVRPARLGETRSLLTQDAYGSGRVRRSVVAIRGLIQSGNSGGPAVDGRGRVVGTVFAATLSGPRGGYGVPNATVREALGDRTRAASTGPCAR